MSGSAVDVDIGVIYSGERHWLYPLLESLSRSAEGVPVRLILVDNCAHDAIHGLEEWFPHHRVLHNKRRQGYAANVNRILVASTAPYTLVLNTDMQFDPRQRSIGQMLDFMERHPRCGLAGCRILHKNGRFAHSARRFPTLRMVLSRRIPWFQAFPAARQRYLYADRNESDSFRCDWVSGCFMMIRDSARRQVGPFDEKYPRYFEDVDYCQRMSIMGWDVMYHGGTYCYHYEQRASMKLFSAAAMAHVYSYCRWRIKQRTFIGTRKESKEGYPRLESGQTRTA